MNLGTAGFQAQVSSYEDRGQQAFSIKGQSINISVSVDYRFPVTATQFCNFMRKQDSTQMNEDGCVLINLCL